MERAFLPGFKVGHYTEPSGTTGCTVVIPPAGNVCSYDMRGSSPGSRELASLDLERRATEVHGILLTGGSAFGLAAADGVMAWLEEHGIGYQTDVATIPIVPAAVIFDMGAAGQSRLRAEAGYAACEAARDGPVAVGRVGAGIGATVGKWAGREFRVPGGLGTSVAEIEGHRVAAIAVVNAFGDVINADGSVLAGTTARQPTFRPPPARERAAQASTVLAVVATIASLDKSQVRFMAARGSDGITTSIRPAHTRYDGDVVFAVAAPGEPGTPALDVLGMLATAAVAAAIRNAVASEPVS